MPLSKLNDKYTALLKRARGVYWNGVEGKTLCREHVTPEWQLIQKRSRENEPCDVCFDEWFAEVEAETG